MKKYLFIALYILSPGLPIVALLLSNPDKYTDPDYLVPMALGCIAFTWLTAEFILSARPKFIEVFFGLDKIYRFHSLTAVLSVVLVIMHKTIEENVIGEMFTSRFGNLALIIFAGITLLAFLLMTDSLAIRSKAFKKIKKYAEKTKIAKYEFQVLIHNLTIAGLVLMFIHVLFTSSAKYYPVVKAIYVLYFLLAAGFYIYHKVIKRIFINSRRYTVSEVLKESNNMWTLRLIPKSGKIPSYSPGQFMFLRILEKGRLGEEHPFSISSSPENKEYISVTIKELGDYTSAIKNIKPSTDAVLDGPYGRFSYVFHKDEEELVLISGGVGITPVMSMLRHIYDTDRNRNVILLWGVNNPDEIIFNDELEKMKREMGSLSVAPVVFKDDSWNGEKGIIDRERIESVLKNLGADPGKKGYYVCGPAIMMKTVIRGLKTMGIKRARIHYERFSM
ncbi:MAG TPA: ferredoxin reductase family protein [Clostridia bacterium]